MEGIIDPAKLDILCRLDKIKFEYETIYNHLKNNHPIKSRIMYGAIKNEVKNSLTHVIRQKYWVENEAEEVKQ